MCRWCSRTRRSLNPRNDHPSGADRGRRSRPRVRARRRRCWSSWDFPGGSGPVSARAFGRPVQRASFARALAVGPTVLVADEPVSALDVSVQARILNLLRDLRRELGLSVILVAHDLAVVRNVCDRVCVMNEGLFVDAGPAEEVFAHPRRTTKTAAGAVPDVARALRARTFA